MVVGRNGTVGDLLVDDPNAAGRSTAPVTFKLDFAALGTTFVVPEVDEVVLFTLVLDVDVERDGAESFAVNVSVGEIVS